MYIINIYTLSDLGDLSNLIGSRSRTIQQYLPPSEWIMCQLGVFPRFLRERSFKSLQNPSCYFFKARKDLERFKTAFFHLLFSSWIFRSMDCLQLPFIQLSVSYLEKFGPKIELYLWQTNLKANVRRNFTFQVNRTKNATGKRRLISTNQAATFVSTLCEERHNKPYWL